MKHYTCCTDMVRQIFLFFLLVMLVACSEKHQEPLRISSSPWPGYEPLYLARDLGYLAAAKVNLFELPSSDINMESFRNHSADMATLTLDEALELLSSGVKLRIVLVLDVSHGGDAVLARPEIRSLKDIKGKTISIVNIPLGLYMLSRTLDVAGVSRNEVTVLPMADSRQEDFYKQKKADVVITYEPFKSKLIDDGAHVLFDSSQIPNEIFDLLLVHEDVYLERREDICHVVKQWFKTLDYIKANHDDSARRITRRLGVGIDSYDAMMSGIVLPTREENKNILGGDKPAILGPVGVLTNIMQAEKLLSSSVDVAAALDASFVSCFQ